MAERRNCVDQLVYILNIFPMGFSCKNMAALPFWNQMLCHFSSFQLSQATQVFGIFPCSPEHFSLINKTWIGELTVIGEMGAGGGSLVRKRRPLRPPSLQCVEERSDGSDTLAIWRITNCIESSAFNRSRTNGLWCTRETRSASPPVAASINQSKKQ